MLMPGDFGAFGIAIIIVTFYFTYSVVLVICSSFIFWALFNISFISDNDRLVLPVLVIELSNAIHWSLFLYSATNLCII